MQPRRRGWTLVAVERSNPISVVLPEAHDDLSRALPRRGFPVHGPAGRGGVIVYDELVEDGGDA